MRVACGGAGRNIAENLARLGVSTALLSVVGTDSYARTILEETAAAGVNVDYLRVAAGVRSALYLAVLDQHGHLSVSVGEMGCLELINPPYIYAHRGLIDNARMVVVDANLSTAAIGTIVALAKRRGVPVCMATVASALAPKAKRYLRDYHIVIGNADEMSALCGAAHHRHPGGGSRRPPAGGDGRQGGHHHAGRAGPRLRQHRGQRLHPRDPDGSGGHHGRGRRADRGGDLRPRATTSRWTRRCAWASRRPRSPSPAAIPSARTSTKRPCTNGW